MSGINQKDWVAKWAVFSPHKVAVKEYESNKSLTYAQLNRQGEQLAVYLREARGLKKGDRVAVLAENCLEYIVCFVAAQKTGIVLVPLNYRLAAPELDYLLTDADPSLLLYESGYEELIDQLVPQQPVDTYGLSKLFAAAQNYDGVGRKFVAAEIADDDPIFILYTSGTTGYPKGAIYTHKMLFWNSINTSLSLLVNTESRTINVMPPFHTGGWNVLTTPFLHHGGYVCLLKKFDTETVLRLLEEEAASIFMGVPTMLKMMAESPSFDRVDYAALHYIIVGGEAMPIPLIEKWEARGVPIRQGYGMTEVGPNLTSLHQSDAIRKKGSIGRPNFYVELKVMKADDQEAATDEAGELWLRGPMVTPGYWRNQSATAAAFQSDWFKSGDLARVDAEGYIYIVDRIKNMFISGGENVYPAEIERILLQHPGIAEVAVIGVAHEKWGEAGKAFVVPAEQQALDADELQIYCQSRMAKFKVPKMFVFITELPKNDTGKIDRKALG